MDVHVITISMHDLAVANNTQLASFKIEGIFVCSFTYKIFQMGYS